MVMDTFVHSKPVEMHMLVNCSNCHTPLQLPPEAKSSRCALCQAIPHIADPRSLPPPPSPPPHPYTYYSAPLPPPPAPSPYYHAPPGLPPSPHGHKRAVICGISYRNSKHELKGCINDAKCMRHLLINKYSFPESSILILTGTITIPYIATLLHLGCSVMLIRPSALFFWCFFFSVFPSPFVFLFLTEEYQLLDKEFRPNNKLLGCFYGKMPWLGKRVQSNDRREALSGSETVQILGKTCSGQRPEGECFERVELGSTEEEGS
ncbi:hypothetical protein NE237_000233 [Protea cynaroides]|uniref:Uncharacterized protein n=1 Tax=Protea cynaroides TaxID=273540 RepID=A0A9Q0KQT2_9MAGN|nr:hypothetical protein NE237_000233 [Protea cynaroides]